MDYYMVSLKLSVDDVAVIDNVLNTDFEIDWPAVAQNLQPQFAMVVQQNSFYERYMRDPSETASDHQEFAFFVDLWTKNLAGCVNMKVFVDSLVEVFVNLVVSSVGTRFSQAVLSILENSVHDVLRVYQFERKLLLERIQDSAMPSSAGFVPIGGCIGVTDGTAISRVYEPVPFRFG